MKILLINYEYPPLGGGAGNVTFYFLREFSRYSNLQVDLITSSTGQARFEKFSPNINIHFLDIGKNTDWHYQTTRELLMFSWQAFFLARKLNRDRQYHLMHAFFGVPCGFIAGLLGIPYIVSLCGSDVPFYNLRFRWLDRLIFRNLSLCIWHKASGVVSNSEGLKELAAKTSPNQKISVIYNGIDTERFTPKEKSRDSFVILSTSRLIQRKGLEYLIAGFAEFQKGVTNTKLILVGTGNLEAQLRKEAGQLGLSPKVEFKGTISHEELPKVYQDADVFVLPSFNEGMSNAVLEAMASGLPIITTDTGGTKELVDERNGIIVRKGSSEDIFHAMERIHSKKDLCHQMGVASRKKAEVMPWGKMVNKYNELYKKAISQRAKQML